MRYQEVTAFSYFPEANLMTENYPPASAFPPLGEPLPRRAARISRTLAPAPGLGLRDTVRKTPVCDLGEEAIDVRDNGRRARIVAAVTEKDTAAGAGELITRLCRFAVDEMALSGCALVLMTGTDSSSMLAGAGRHASTVTGLQMELGEGPCLQAYSSGVPVFLPDLAAENANRWPAFAAAALAVGVHAEFSLPLTVGPGGIGTLDLCRDRPGMLSEEHLAVALVTADIARDAVLYQQQYTPRGTGLAELLDMGGTDRIVIHQATGMIAAQLNDTTSNALARLRAAAFASGRPMHDIAQDVVERRMRFDD
jgi:hypothetical protein